MRPQKSRQGMNSDTVNALANRIAYALLGALMGGVIVVVFCVVVGFDLLEVLDGQDSSLPRYALAAVALAFPLGGGLWGFIAPHQMSEALGRVIENLFSGFGPY